MPRMPAATSLMLSLVASSLMTTVVPAAASGSSAAEAKALAVSVHYAYAQWQSRIRELYGLWEKNDERDVSRMWEKDLNGDGNPERLTVEFSYGGGSSAHVPAEVDDDQHGTIFEGQFGEYGDLLFVDLDRTRRGIEIVTTEYELHEYYTAREMAELEKLRRLPESGQAKGIAMDVNGTRVQREDRREAHLTPHQYIATVWVWDAAEGQYTPMDTYASKRMYDPTLTHRYLLEEFCRYWSWRNVRR